MFTVGIIGAGTIAARHIDAYKANKNCYLKAIFFYLKKLLT